MSRIAELTTRSAKLNTGTAYFAVDQSSEQVTNKIDYAELARQIITEYNAQTLAGTAQSVKAALDTLKSDMTTTTGFNNITTQVSSLDDIPLNTYGLVALPTELSPTGEARQFFYQCYGTSTRATLDLINVGTANSGRYFSKKESTNWSDWKRIPTQAEMDAVSTVETITAEVSAEEVASSGWNIVIKKVGNVVSINGYVVLANPTKTNVTITLATLPQSVRPSVAIRTTAGIAAHAYEQPEGMCYAGVGTNGVLSVRLQTDNLAKNSNVYMSISYII